MSFTSTTATPTENLAGRGAEIQALAAQLLGRHGLGDWTFRFNRRKTEMGLCLYGPKQIELSIYFVERNGDAAIRETLLHEIAHALAGPGHGHDAVWKQKCRELGARPQRLGPDVNMPEGRWQAQCAGCGRLHSKHRRPKHLVGWYCVHCGRDHGQLTWTRAG